ncbi:hypothetical protein FQN57_003222 [Myotisia sp. PD_48]|nr:hypothetical protein FQN57_003222 [Myotisia sp. PD_48]
MSPFSNKGGKGVCAMFVHAGAGFHSHQSEQLHLWVCNQAARLGLAVLRAGGNAVDGVEAAIKFLEDHEITNAGYGSNLTLSGVVECDATVMDHLGRSGAVGAVRHIKNPISLARVILDASTQPLSLNRVPPNLLVGTGATDFAYEYGMPVLPGDTLVAPGAKDRWRRWKADLEQIDGKLTVWDSQAALESQGSKQSSPGGSPISSLLPIDTVVKSPARSNGCTPHPNSPVQFPKSSDGTANITSLEDTSDVGGHPAEEAAKDGELKSVADFIDIFHHLEAQTVNPQAGINDLADGTIHPRPSLDSQDEPPANRLKTQHADSGGNETAFRLPSFDLSKTDDEISDTVGAIAVDCYGNIAAGSSSGGIGMKHSGRTGPAALVGIGTAVLPVDPGDETGASVATVASGTGEHMATTMSAQTCSQRLYAGTKKLQGQPAGYEFATEDEVLKSVIEHDFMGHPAVSASHCHAAIGLMSIKKTRDGVIFLFGHNTDSFAVASMSSEDLAPCCTMSRSPGGGKVAQGGRYIRLRRYKSVSPAE